ncbi:MAG: hypothetical protein JWQ29_1078 [Phenylobacterium sp.]|nr:hypothetical protein [Phenylobacterium sp.]
MTTTPLRFPVLAFGPDVGRNAVPGRERLDYFLNEYHVSTCTSWDLKHGARQSMLLIDCTGRCWRVVDVEDLGVTGGLWERVLRFLVQQSVHRVAQEIVEEAALSLHDLKERVCASIEADRDRWRGDDIVLGEDGEVRGDQEILDELQAAVRKAETLPQVINALYDEDLAG